MSATEHSSSDFDASEQTAQSPRDEVPVTESSTPASDAQREPSSLSLLFLMACVLFLAAWFVGPRLVEEYQFAATKGKLRAEYENAVTLLDSQPLQKVSLTSQLVAQKAKPSVVSISTEKLTEVEGEPGVRDPRGSLQGFGSGVIMTQDGYIVTCAHVTEDAKRIWVDLNDRRRFGAVEVGRDEKSDIAVLKIEANGLIPAKWGDSDKLEVGSMVWAVGSPYRYLQTVTSGIISAKDRIDDKFPEENWNNPIDRIRNLLQTDVAVNKGNSGGPMVNADGDVIGIVVSIYGETFQGISFAIPSSTARFIFEQIIGQGEVVRGFLGARPVQVNNRVATRLGLPDLDGAMLGRVKNDSPAGRAGLQRFDVVRTWNDTPIHRYNSLYRLAERSAPGSVVEVSLIRDGQPYSASVTMGEAPESSSGLQIEVQE